MNHSTKVLGAILAFTMMGTSGVWAADCGAKPTAPEVTGDGAKMNGKEMEKVVTGFDEYQTKFVTYSDCINKEFNEASNQFKAVMSAYQDKNKKK